MDKTPPQCISNIFERGTYTPGDGEVVAAMRTGSQDALGLPSKISNKLHYRDGRVQVQHLPADDTEGGAV